MSIFNTWICCWSSEGVWAKKNKNILRYVIYNFLPGIVNVRTWSSVLSAKLQLRIYSINGKPPVSDDWTRISTPFVSGLISETLTFCGGSARWSVNECRPTRGFDARHSKLKPKSRSVGVY